MKFEGLLYPILLVGVLSRIAHAAGSTKVPTTSRLQIHTPPNLKKVGGYDHRDALFGIPPYGGAITQQLYYADSDLCDPIVDKTRGYPERPTDTKGKMGTWESPFILMVDRGRCTFVQKVRNAQKAGAAAVLIADTICMCSDEECMNVTKSNRYNCERKEPIMADDGSGSDISIPSFLVFKHDADPIITALKNNNPVRAEMTFSVPDPDNRVEYELWTTPTEMISRDFLLSFQKAAARLGQDAFFTPHEFVFDGVKAGCQQNGADVCSNLCTNAGKYCGLDPDENVLAGATGADVVAESLRRNCIWETYGTDGIGKEWWDYVNEFRTRCNSSGRDTNKFKDPACISKTMKVAHIDAKKVQKCMDDSGGLQGNVENTIFKDQQARMEKLGVILVPSFYVNEVPIRGSISFATAFEAICAGYAPGSEPVVCQRCSKCGVDGLEMCVEHGVCASADAVLTKGVSVQVFAMSFLALIMLLAMINYGVRQRQRLVMRDQVRDILGQYMPLDENKAPGDYTLPADEESFTIS